MGKDYGDATERQSVYAKASAYAEAFASALCAMADKSEDKCEIGGEGVARQVQC